jgi:hypothetical protein
MNVIKRFFEALSERWLKPEVPSPVQEKTRTLVTLLMRDYTPKEQNEIMYQTLNLLIEKRLELAELKSTELQELEKENRALCVLTL